MMPIIYPGIIKGCDRSVRYESRHRAMSDMGLFPIRNRQNRNARSANALKKR